MPTISDYTDLITSEHRQRPKYIAVVQAITQPLVDVGTVMLGMPEDFDLDSAVGKQLDTVGDWVGIKRQVSTPITGVYFSFDTESVGFDQGTWKGPFDPDSGIVNLDNESYRTLIKAKIGANHWDGTMENLVPIINAIFPGDTKVFVQDNQDMTMTIGLAGPIPPALSLALLAGGYIPIKPAGVGTNTIVTSADGAAIFGFDMDNEYISGFDMGAWGTPL